MTRIYGTSKFMGNCWSRERGYHTPTKPSAFAAPRGQYRTRHDAGRDSQKAQVEQPRSPVETRRK